VPRRFGRVSEVVHCRLGADYDRVVQRVERILLPAFDSWRIGGEDATPVVGLVVGTLDWMFHEYRRTWPQKTAKRLQALSPGQCRVHETGIKIICEYLLQDGRRPGTRRVSSIDTAFVDDLFGKLLFKEVKGEKVERRTTVNHGHEDRAYSVEYRVARQPQRIRARGYVPVRRRRGASRDLPFGDVLDCVAIEYLRQHFGAARVSRHDPSPPKYSTQDG
jgi:hypothetical protein